MKSFRSLFLFTLLANACLGAPEFVGVLRTSAGTYVDVIQRDARESKAGR
jgi:hypothetical protein